MVFRSLLIFSIFLVLLFGCVSQNVENTETIDDLSTIDVEVETNLDVSDELKYEESELTPKHFSAIGVITNQGHFNSSVKSTWDNEGLLLEFSPSLVPYMENELLDSYSVCGGYRNSKFDVTPAILTINGIEWSILDVNKESVIIAKEVQNKHIHSFNGCGNNNQILSNLDNSEFIYENDYNNSISKICLVEGGSSKCEEFELDCSIERSKYHEDNLIWAYTTDHGCHICMWWAIFGIYSDDYNLVNHGEIEIIWENEDSFENLSLKSIFIPKSSEVYSKLKN